MVRAPLLCLLLSLIALSGCLGPSEPPEETDATMPDDGAFLYFVKEGTADPASIGPWYDRDTDVIDGPVVLRIVNDDQVFHQIVGQLGAPADPGWAFAYHAHTAVVDESQPHSHAGSPAGDVIFDVDVEAGKWKDVTLTGDGVISIHCHPHPWMVDTLALLPGAQQDYAVVRDHATGQGELNGTQTLSDPAADVTAFVAAADLQSLTAVLTWNDAEADGPLGEASNSPDTFHVSLVGPDGTVRAEGEQAARNGVLEVTYTAPAPGWPDSVTATGLVEADKQLRALDSFADSGVWTVHVELVSAPGYADVPAGYDTWSGVPGSDGYQSWSLSVQAVHEWGGVGREAHDTTGPLSLAV